MAKKYELNENEQAQVAGGTNVTLSNNSFLYGCDSFALKNGSNGQTQVCAYCQHHEGSCCTIGKQNTSYNAITTMG